MGWQDEFFCALDTETTGTDVESDRIVTATVVWIKGRQIEAREWLINPGVEIPQAAIDVHHVTNERARAEGLAPATALAQIFSELDDAWTAHRPVVIYNAAFDLTILDRELRRHCGQSLDGVIGPVIDPFCIDKALDPYRKGSRKLTDVCMHYNVRLDDAHTSTGDALAAARLAWRLAQVYPEQLADLGLVNGLQADWREQWATNFTDWLRSQGKDEQIRGEWPLIPFEPVPA
jgi:DNA polymerase-3 subunit epsilon